ncbi:MAG TPA: LysM peptidoglycan-binding domain-containing protein, partial [Prolixibacteraceae bacterium]|nr:LysM peptidoglycan-binding domain-containing protein [Prolixibacteraceae bacterium]
MSANMISTKEISGSTRKMDLLVVFLLLFSTFLSFGQSGKNYEKVVIGDFRYILHDVQKKETLYSISRLYGCSQEEVLAANKNITGVIKKGMVLKIPDHSYKKPQSAKIDESKFTQHQIVSGDNYYQLKLKYGVEEEELLKYNPDLKNGLKAGKVILIPVKSKSGMDEKELPSKETSENEPISPSKAKSTGKVLNVGLYLPISAAVIDSLKPTAKTLSFLAFYQGALLAVDKLSK